MSHAFDSVGAETWFSATAQAMAPVNGGYVVTPPSQTMAPVNGGYTVTPPGVPTKPVG